MKKIMLITGASGHLGTKICSHFLDEYYLFMVDINKSALVLDIEMNKKGKFFKIDLSDSSEIISFSKKIKKFNISKIILGAGIIQQQSSFLLSNLEEWNNIINVNVTANYLLCRELINKDLKSETHIVAISSIFSEVVGYDLLSYNVSKAALNHLVRNVSLELINNDVYINSINLGFMESEMYESIKQNRLLNVNWMYSMGGINKLYIEVDDVINLINYLLKQRSMTGQALTIDKGYSIR